MVCHVAQLMKYMQYNHRRSNTLDWVWQDENSGLHVQSILKYQDTVLPGQPRSAVDTLTNTSHLTQTIHA